MSRLFKLLKLLNLIPLQFGGPILGIEVYDNYVFASQFFEPNARVRAVPLVKIPTEHSIDINSPHVEIKVSGGGRLYRALRSEILALPIWLLQSCMAKMAVPTAFRDSKLR